ncbi:hypothetical protein FL966_05835 [Caproiciproducens galactitolivorans]|uniref:DUF2577 domain-containing protein n=1 Tax=Caproiciproducens galactitolivorans TaxID=642589 RepID=A0A4Z0YC58_9FIRM|nr:hypothetical protein [Caproiciproducens galactitolivorans]QEY34611.1 hypothetical protein FL966_05835 [Caproiciproducens galactitolivorans]TGJ75426.1 hypothetical protein CAGA_24510 [Caproiciproducens galactitolivorans]
MEDNPYVKIVQLVRNQADRQIPTLFRLGTVISPNPLKIDVSSTVQDEGALFKNAALGELESGDSVLLVTLDGDQHFIILCKVVGV